jgi:hypothetical protein
MSIFTDVLCQLTLLLYYSQYYVDDVPLPNFSQLSISSSRLLPSLLIRNSKHTEITRPELPFQPSIPNMQNPSNVNNTALESRLYAHQGWLREIITVVYTLSVA